MWNYWLGPGEARADSRPTPSPAPSEGAMRGQCWECRRRAGRVGWGGVLWRVGSRGGDQRSRWRRRLWRLRQAGFPRRLPIWPPQTASPCDETAGATLKIGNGFKGARMDGKTPLVSRPDALTCPITVWVKRKRFDGRFATCEPYSRQT